MTDLEMKSKTDYTRVKSDLKWKWWKTTLWQELKMKLATDVFHCGTDGFNNCFELADF